MLRQKCGHRSMAFAECRPHGCAPGIDGTIALSPLGGCHDLDCGEGAAFAWQRERRPTPSVPAQCHVNPLHLPPGELPFDVEIQAYEREGQPDAFGTRIRVLRGPGVHDMLMDE